MADTIDARYAEALRTIPAPGQGCHPALLTVANLGILAGRTPEAIFEEIRRSIPSGDRRVPDREIQDAVNKAGADCRPKDRPAPQRTRTERRDLARHLRQAERREHERRRKAKQVAELADRIPEADPAGLWERSPTRLTDDADQDAVLLLTSLYGPRERVWCGRKYDRHTPQPPAEWTRRWRVVSLPNFIICNPLDGERHPSSSGKESYRCDAAVASHRFVLIEFDKISIEQQAGRIAWMLDHDWPIAAVIHSGGKSLHAWLRVDLPDADAWRREVHDDLFPNYLVPLGADPACRNAARLSRLPGAIRDNASRSRQHLLYLNAPTPASGPISAPRHGQGEEIA